MKRDIAKENSAREKEHPEEKKGALHNYTFESLTPRIIESARVDKRELSTVPPGTNDFLQ